MTKLITLLCIALQFALASTAMAAGSDRGRAGFGPFDMTAPSTCYPTAAGFSSKDFDGDMKVFQFYRGSGAIAYTIQVSGYTTLQDPSNLSFQTVASRDQTVALPDTIIGPIERFRFCTTTCTGDCTMRVKVTGRVHP